MTENLRAELERLKQRQAQLHHSVDVLGVHIQALEKRIAEEETATAREGFQSADSEIAALAAVPPVLPVVEQVKPEVMAEETPIVSALLSGRKVATPELESPVSTSGTPPPLPPELVAKPSASDGLEKSDSFEMRLGTYWLVRIGIVAMLTALVFFGTYAYQNYIGKLGPGGKVALLYLASGALLGFGAWFQRRAARESLRNYAQVLLAGGMAAVYFTTYAAHHFPNLKVIASATLDATLLLGWAGFMAWVADRKKSEVLALFAVGLAYYTSVITHVGHFTLYSNLVLAAAVVFFLVRNRWAKLSYASLIATYASYGFWRFYVGQEWEWADEDAGLWKGIYFLAAYWAVFTTAVFWSRHKDFAGARRAIFITLNNAAFYVMFLLTIFQVGSGGFWKLNLIMGAVLLCTAALAKVRLRNEPLAANTYLAHGLLLVTAGVIAKFNRDQSTLALALAMESVVLWFTGTLTRNIIMRTGACVSGALATLWTLDGIEPNDAPGVWLAAGVGGLLLFNAFWSHWKGQGKSPALLRAAPTYFSAFALMLWSLAIWQNVSSSHRPAAYALMVLACVASIHVLRLRELALLAQLLLPAAALLFIVYLQSADAAELWWAYASVGGVALALVHWWQRQRVVELGTEGRHAGQVLMAIVFAGVTGLWLEPLCNPESWLLATSGLVLVLTAYGLLTRNGIIALVGQGFAAAAVISFLLHAGSGNLTWLAALAPLLSLGALAVGGQRWSVSRADSLPGIASQVQPLARWYGRLAMALLAWWLFQYADVQELVWSYTAMGTVAFVLSGVIKHRDLLRFAIVLHGCAVLGLLYQLSSETAVYWPNFVSVLAWMALQQAARRQAERFPGSALIHNTAMIVAGIALWSLGSRWVMQGFSGFYLTAGWSLYAFGVFALGIALRERIYRWIGLAVLGAALGRVAIFDVWKLDTLYRILSFFALGLVLLVLGFIYNKYQERIRQWL